LDLAKYMIDLPGSALPSAFGISYGEPEHSIPEIYTSAVCQMFAMLGTRGVSVVFATGDFGPASDAFQMTERTRCALQQTSQLSCLFVISVGVPK